jgi:uncharacterized membrane protein
MFQADRCLIIIYCTVKVRIFEVMSDSFEVVGNIQVDVIYRNIALNSFTSFVSSCANITEWFQTYTSG